MLDAVLNLFTLQGLFHFATGAGVAGLWHIVKARRRGEIVIFRWKYIATPFVLAIAMYISAQTQQNANCVREFNQTLRVRSAITAENDALSIQQRELIYHWIHTLVFPPPDVADLDPDDPARERWAINFTIETDRLFAASIEEQRVNDTERAAHPLPPPTCGL